MKSFKTGFLLALLCLLVVSGSVFAMEEVIAETKIPLIGDRISVRTQETNLGNLVCDAILSMTGADIAFYNGGGIRDSADLGPITLEQALAIMAFNNSVVTLELTGKTIIETLEHSVAAFPNASGAFLQVAGIRFYYNPTQQPLSRVVKVYVGEELIDEEKTYIVATNDFLAAGGSGFSMLQDKEALEVFELLDSTMFVRYIHEQSPLFITVEGRIVIVK